MSWAEISCSRVSRGWSACPRRRIPFFRNRWGYCCTNANVERSMVSEGLAGQAAGAGPRTGSRCCSCCRSAISVGEARWSGPLELPQCLPTAPLHCPSASRQLRYTVSWSMCDSSTSNPTRSARLCRGAVWEWGKQVGSMDEESQVRGCCNITFICTPTRKQCRLSPEMNT